MATLLHPYLTNKDRIYIATLRLTPKYTKGVMVLISQDIDEKLYNVIKDNLYSRSNIGKVELGYTANNGVKLRIATAVYDDIPWLIAKIRQVANDVVTKGIQGDLKQMKKPRQDLAYSLSNLRVLKIPIIKPEALAKPLLGITYDISERVRTNKDLKEVQSAMLVPPNAEAEVF